MKPETTIAAVGDTHGHLQLACAVLARWQKELAVQFEAVFLCGDVGCFTEDSQLDNATRRHVRTNPCELEFLTQWAAHPPAPWLDYLFKPEEEGGLGLECPVVMVPGNHEGFAHLERLVPPEIPQQPVGVEQLPGVDTLGHIRLLPSGWRLQLPSGYLVAGVGGIDPSQREARYHPMAYLDEEAILHLCGHEKVDVLVTHQGPSGVQGEHGSDLLQLLLEERPPRLWFHGHSRSVSEVTRAGRGRSCLVVPLGDIAFPARGPDAHQPGKEGWAWATLGERDASVVQEPPPFLREFSRHRWTPTPEGQLICPPLAQRAWQLVRSHR